MASPAPTVFLKDEKLRQLAQLIRNHEINNLYHITFNNLGDQLQYLRMCNDNMASVNTLLDECNALVTRFKADGVRGLIADQILVYAEHCLNNALQIIRNYTMRRSYLDKMIDHLHQLFHALGELDSTSSGDHDVADLTELIQDYDQKVMSFMKLSLNSYASAEFSRYLRTTGIGFSELVQRYQAKLGYTGRFEKLEEEQKLAVYNAIIEASGRLSVLLAERGDDMITNRKGLKASKGRPSVLAAEAEQRDDMITKAAALNRKGLKASEGRQSVFAANQGGDMSLTKAPSSRTTKIPIAKYGSAAMFLIDMGHIIWDVYSSDHPITTAMREALVLAAKKGGAALGKLVGTAVATCQLVGAEASALFVTACGLVGGFVGGFILGATAGLLFNLIFGSGGEAVLPTDGFIVYVAVMPSGHDLAKQIAYAS